MNRETKTIKTTSGKEVVLHSWITARERRELKEITLRFAKFGMETESGREGLTQKPVMKEYDAAGATKALEEAKIRIVVSSYDGSADNIVDRLLDGHEGDWNEVFAAVEEITENPVAPK